MQRFEELPFKMKEEVYMQCFVRDQQIDEEDKKNVSPKNYELENTYDFSPTNS
jgi:hypothetical protein